MNFADKYNFFSLRVKCNAITYVWNIYIVSISIAIFFFRLWLKKKLTTVPYDEFHNQI